MATFRQRNGRWQAIIRRVDLKATKSFDRLTDAKAWARAAERDADMKGTEKQKMVGTLAALIDRYEREMWPDKRWGTNKAHELKTIRAALGHKALDKLDRAAFLDFAREAAQGLAPGGVTARLSYLREVIRTGRDLWNLAVPLEALEAAIGTALRMKFAGRSGTRTRRPTEAELAKLLDYAAGQTNSMIDLGALIRVLAVLPLRVGELLGIGWADLNEARRTAVIRSRKHPDVNVREGNDQEVPLITFGGVDTFDLIASRSRYMEGPFPYKRPSVSMAFGMAVLRCQIKDLHLHDLRAHALSSLLEAGVPIPQVALISGHRSWKVLSRHYSRIDPASVHDSITRASR